MDINHASYNTFLLSKTKIILSNKSFHLSFWFFVFSRFLRLCLKVLISIDKFCNREIQIQIWQCWLSLKLGILYNCGSNHQNSPHPMLCIYYRYSNEMFRQFKKFTCVFLYRLWRREYIPHRLKYSPHIFINKKQKKKGEKYIKKSFNYIKCRIRM